MRVVSAALLVVLLMLVGCTTITLPIQDYALARSAMEAAEGADSERLAPLVFQQAQQVFQQAEHLYRAREFEEARLHFLKARKLAEKAEVISRNKKSKSGEVL